MKQYKRIEGIEAIRRLHITTDSNGFEFGSSKFKGETLDILTQDKKHIKRATFGFHELDRSHLVAVTSEVLKLDNNKLATFAGNIKIPNDGTIGCASDVDLIKLESGKLTINGELAASSFTGSLSGTATNLSGSQTQKYVYAAPNNENGTASFRALIASDIPTLNQNTTGSAATLTTARTIGGVSFNGSADINLPGVNTGGNQKYSK